MYVFPGLLVRAGEFAFPSASYLHDDFACLSVLAPCPPEYGSFSAPKAVPWASPATWNILLPVILPGLKTEWEEKRSDWDSGGLQRGRKRSMFADGLLFVFNGLRL